MSLLNITNNNLLDLEYSIFYQSYIIKTTSNINNLIHRNNSNVPFDVSGTVSDIARQQAQRGEAGYKHSNGGSPGARVPLPEPLTQSTNPASRQHTNLIISDIKLLLNTEKDKIDNYQLNLTQKTLIESYNSSNLYEILKIKNLNYNFKKNILKQLFYTKLTDTIYVMNFKANIKSVFNIKNLTNAGLKLTEILFNENIITSVKEGGAQNNQFHHFANAELPGSFIVAVNYFINTKIPHLKYVWTANSLLPGNMGPNSPGLGDYFGYYKNHKNNWLMSNDMNGDITNIKNLDFIKNHFNINGKVDLYTSDAGINLDVGEYNRQESIELQLKISEIVCALISLKSGGNMVIKAYTFFEKTMIDVIIILSKLFEVLKIIKPMTSKPANSEIYIVGKNFLSYELAHPFIDLFISYIKDFDTNINFDINPTHSNFNGFLLDISDTDLLLFNNISKNIYYKQINWIKRNIYYFNLFYNDDSFINYKLFNNIFIKNISKLVDFYYNKFIDSYELRFISNNSNL
tara:strand:- start:131 stop:1681 length:1551 start_codon:yes stop_codon:yes gene_type:complete